MQVELRDPHHLGGPHLDGGTRRTDAASDHRQLDVHGASGRGHRCHGSNGQLARRQPAWQSARRSHCLFDDDLWYVSARSRLAWRRSMTAASDRESPVVALPGVMALMGLLLFVLRSHVAAFFSDDPAVIAVVTECMLVLAIFQVRSFNHCAPSPLRKAQKLMIGGDNDGINRSRTARLLPSQESFEVAAGK